MFIKIYYLGPWSELYSDNYHDDSIFVDIYLGKKILRVNTRSIYICSRIFEQDIFTSSGKSN